MLNIQARAANDFCQTPPVDWEARRLLREFCWFHPLPEAETALLASYGKWRSFVKGEMLFHEGEKMSACFLLDSGCVEIFRYTVKGGEKVFSHIHGKEAVALAAVFMNHGCFPMNGRAIDDGRALLVPCHAIRDLCMRRPELSLQLLNHFCGRLYATVNQVDWLTSSSTAERLADYLLKQCSNCTRSCTLRLPLNRMQLATHLGMRHETLSRLMSEWQKQNHIQFNGNRVQILNVNFLRQLAEPARRSF